MVLSVNNMEASTLPKLNYWLAGRNFDVFSQCLLRPAKHYAGAQKSLRAFYLLLSDVYFLPLFQAFILTSQTKSPLFTHVWQHPFINFLLFEKYLSASLNEDYKKKASYMERDDYQNVF